MSHANKSGPSQRQLRVGEQLRHVLSETLRRGHFNNEDLMNLAQNISITEVRPSPNLRDATAYVMTLGGQDMDIILPALNEEAYSFQKEINHQLNMKFTPKVRFVKDESFDEAQKIEDILRNLS